MKKLKKGEVANVLAIDKYRTKWSNEESKLILEYYKEIDFVKANLTVCNIIMKLDEALENELQYSDNGYKLYLALLIDKLIDEGEMNEIVTLNAIMKENNGE